MNLRFDGCVSSGTFTYKVRGLPVCGLRVERLDSSSLGISIIVYLRTILRVGDKLVDVELRMRQPSGTYERFHKPFLWIATFGTYVADYLGRSRTSVGLHDFQSDFGWWLKDMIGQCDSVHRWFSQVNHKVGFRTALNANVHFSWNQIVGHTDRKNLDHHALWADCLLGGRDTVEKQRSMVQGTVVTKHVFECFQGMPFTDQLRKTPFSTASSRERRRKMELLGFAEAAATRLSTKTPVPADRVLKIGDLVSFTRSRTRRVALHLSFGLVQAIVPSKRHSGVQRLHILHVYRPD